METLTETTKYAFFHIEWWSDRSGSDVMAEVMRALTTWHNVDGCHVYNREALEIVPTRDGGEADIFFSVHVTDIEDYGHMVDTIRANGFRVKTAAYLADRADVATGTMNGLWEWFDTDI